MHLINTFVVYLHYIILYYIIDICIYKSCWDRQNFSKILPPPPPREERVEKVRP